MRPGRRPAQQSPAPAGHPETLDVVAMGAKGDGLTADGVMVPLTLPGERVLARRDGERAEPLEILEPSPQRVAPPCPHFGACGGCALQHWQSESYLDWKVERVRAALRRVGLEAPTDLAFAAGPGERRRLALHARRDGRDVRLGFKARRTWRLVPIETCVIAESSLVAALPALARLAGPFLASPRSAPILHVTATETGLDVDVTGVERPGPSADDLARAAAAAQDANLARVTLGGEMVYGARPARLRLGPAVVDLPPGAFLQATAGAEAAMGDILVEAAKGARAIADLFCGVGTFTFRLAALAPVTAADASPQAIAALVAASGTAPGLKPIRAQARDLERRPLLAAELAKIDFVVFDPPRAGAAIQAAELARSTVPTVAAVSCNPATFARDARLLADGGFELERIHVVDQFLWSSHIELVALFSRTRA